MNQKIVNFFKWSSSFDHMVTRQLSHIRCNWELRWNHSENKYEFEEDSYAEMINELIVKLSKLDPPKKYHDNEDRLAEYCKEKLRWNINKVGRRWIGADYAAILENGGSKDINTANLCLAACGRVLAGIERGQLHFDDMEESHQKMLADVIAIILYHKENNA